MNKNTQSQIRIRLTLKQQGTICDESNFVSSLNQTKLQKKTLVKVKFPGYSIENKTRKWSWA